MPDGPHGHWSRWPALFERATGLVYVNADHRQWQAYVESWDTEKTRSGSQAFFGRISHEMFHYLQFFATGYVTAICARHFDAIRRAVPFPLDQAKMDTFLAQPQPRPPTLTTIAATLAQPGPSGLTPLQIIEGCARLFQARSERRDLLHGAYLLELARSPHRDVYGRFYNAVTAALGSRALSETLFIGATALEFAEPERAAPLLLDLRARGQGDGGSDDLNTAHDVLVWTLIERFGLDHLGSGLSLTAGSDIRHPLLSARWIYDGSADWERDIREAVWGIRPSIHEDFLNHAEIMLNDVIWMAPRRDKSERDDVEVRYLLARLSLHLSNVEAEEAHV